MALDGLVMSVFTVSYSFTKQSPTHYLLMPNDLFAVVAHSKGAAIPATSHASRPRLHVMGLRTSALPLRLDSSGIAVVALLTPSGFLAVFGTGIDATDRFVPLEEIVDPLQARDLNRRLTSLPASLHADELSGWLYARTLKRLPTAPGAMRAAYCATRMARTGPLPKNVNELVQQVPINRRQLERDFRDWFGVSPGIYLRLARFQRAARQLAIGMPPAEVARAAHYCDQAHLTRSFKAMSDTTPGSVLRQGGLDELHGLHHAASRVLLVGATSNLLTATHVRQTPRIHEPLL